MGICYIIGAGEMADELPDPGKEDLLIACDGGFRCCREKGLKPDLVVGDFDSLGFVPECEQVIQLNPVKDETDMGWAVREGQSRGFKEFVIYGGTGGRMSHTIANIQLLTKLALAGEHGILVGKTSWYQVLHNGEIQFGSDRKGYLSVFCLGDKAEGVYEEGLKYTLDNATLTKEYPVGVSNEFTGKESRVAVAKGTLLLICENMAETWEKFPR